MYDGIFEGEMFLCGIGVFRACWVFGVFCFKYGWVGLDFRFVLVMGFVGGGRGRVGDIKVSLEFRASGGFVGFSWSFSLVAAFFGSCRREVVIAGLGYSGYTVREWRGVVF